MGSEAEALGHPAMFSLQGWQGVWPREARNGKPRPPKKGPPPLGALFAFGSMAPQALLCERPFQLNDVLISIWGYRPSSIAGLGYAHLFFEGFGKGSRHCLQRT